MATQEKYSFTKSLNNDNEVKLVVKVTPAEFISVKENVYQKMAKDVVITGFRPGKGPKNLIEARISQEMYEETINQILPSITSEIIEKEDFVPLSQVKYEIKKFADSEGIEYEANFVNAPEIKLPDFKKIKAQREDINVSEAEVDAEIIKVVKMYDKKNAKKDEEKSSETEVKKDEPKKPIELTDELVKGLNLGFENITSLREQVNKELNAQKKYESEQKYLNQVIEEAVALAKISVPKAMIEDEVHHREHEYTHQIEQIGLKVEDFLKSQNTTLEAMKKDWEKEASKKLAQELLMYQIIKENKITVEAEEMKLELEKLDEKTREQFQTKEGIRYLTTVMLQQKALNYIKDQITKN